ncbi:CHAT domain-containing protein [Rhizobium sp. NFACC06-2]|uniref:CHAT domain-containing protein n=1 Tax=Rhizobium sp. NFACC06-2 TaxID=1566264 RepID=UPI000876A9DE|nr:CHAT domain-containing protein [Rhizobium sp. NFACC06-2]SCY85066.1 CHAT domain-containing protein [Rhizobium sp. NFACC06-2]
MVGKASPLRFFLLGKVDKNKHEQIIKTFVEWNHARAVQTLSLRTEELSTVISAIAELRGHVEGNVGVFDRAALRKLGEHLFGILITGQARILFDQVTGRMKSLGKETLPLEIVAEDHEIAGWPWEYVFDPHGEQFLSQEFHPISRNVFSLDPPRPIQAKKDKLRLLIILGVPIDDPYISPAEELKSIENVFSAHLDVRSFELHILSPKDIHRLQMELQSQAYDIVHFFGHAGFDADEGTGYLAIAVPGEKPLRIMAEDFAKFISRKKSVKLVFLNACKTATSSSEFSPARSSVAGALVLRGVPAVVAAQFSLPDQTAHILAATIYNSLLYGQPLGEAIRAGRTVLSLETRTRVFDWGIPVLYTASPSTKLFSLQTRQPASYATLYQAGTTGSDFVEALAKGGGEGTSQPSVIASAALDAADQRKIKVAIVDFDAKAGFLPELVEVANKAQTYYEFRVAYIPLPSDYLRTDEKEDGQTYVPRLRSYLEPMAAKLEVDHVCCLTQHMVANETHFNLFMSALTDERRVMVVSTKDLRKFAAEADTSFAKTVFSLCLSAVMWADKRWGLEYHQETAGCPMDYCEVRSHITVGLRKMKFDHEPCRSKIHDEQMLAALDALAALDYREQ